jgi:hypothetical protein
VCSLGMCFVLIPGRSQRSLHADMFRLQWFAVRMETENLKIPDSEYTSIYYHNPSNESASGARCFW